MTRAVDDAKGFTKTCLTGELWGMANLFKNSLDILETHQVIGDTRAAEELRIETANFSGLAREPPALSTGSSPAQRMLQTYTLLGIAVHRGALSRHGAQRTEGEAVEALRVW